MGSKKVTLKSSDGQVFEVEEAVALVSQTIKHMIEDDCADDVIPVPNVTGNILSKVIEYCKKHVEMQKLGKDNEVLDEALKRWAANLVKVNELSTVLDLFMVANYLNIKSLLNLTYQVVANVIMGKIPGELLFMEEASRLEWWQELQPQQLLQQLPQQLLRRLLQLPQLPHEQRLLLPLLQLPLQQQELPQEQQELQQQELQWLQQRLQQWWQQRLQLPLPLQQLQQLLPQLPLPPQLQLQFPLPPLPLSLQLLLQQLRLQFPPLLLPQLQQQPLPLRLPLLQQLQQPLQLQPLQLQPLRQLRLRLLLLQLKLQQRERLLPPQLLPLLQWFLMKEARKVAVLGRAESFLALEEARLMEEEERLRLMEERFNYLEQGFLEQERDLMFYALEQEEDEEERRQWFLKERFIALEQAMILALEQFNEEEDEGLSEIIYF